jgi:tetratricopeptide (TPR) repeat protein
MNAIRKYIFLLVVTFYCTSLNALSKENKLPSLERAAEIVAHNPDSASLLARNALFLYQDNSEISGRAYSIIAVAYDIKGKPDSALLFFHKAIHLQEKGSDPKALSYTYSNLGIFYFLQFDYSNALKYYNLSIKIDKANGDLKDLADNLVNLGIVYTYTDSLDKAG